jgi:hypothetical protein
MIVIKCELGCRNAGKLLLLRRQITMLRAGVKAASLAMTANVHLVATTFRFVSGATLEPDGGFNKQAT